MNSLINKKIEYYKQFAETIEKKFMQLRFGVKTPSVEQAVHYDLLRKEIVDWEKNNDTQALHEVSITYSTELRVIFENDLVNETLGFNLSNGGTGSVNYNKCLTDNEMLKINYSNSINNQNIVQVNTEGCITTIDLNPIINVVGNPISVNIPTVSNITLPVNQTVIVANITQGSSPVSSIIWVQVSGPNTATLTNATTNTLTVSGLVKGTYSFKINVLDASGFTVSASTSFVVNDAPALPYTMNFTYVNSDPFAAISAGNDINYSFNQNVSKTASSVALDFTSAGSGKMLVVRQPVAEAAFNNWSFSVLNNGNFNGDSVFRNPLIVGSYRYYISRSTDGIVYETGNKLTLSK